MAAPPSPLRSCTVDKDRPTAVKAQIPPRIYEEHLALAEMVLDVGPSPPPWLTSGKNKDKRFEHRVLILC